METRITEYAGYFIAAKATKIAEAWMGSARIFKSRQSSYDDDNDLAKIAGDLGNAPCALDAVQNAERVARDFIDNRGPL